MGKLIVLSSSIITALEGMRIALEVEYQCPVLIRHCSVQEIIPPGSLRFNFERKLDISAQIRFADGNRRNVNGTILVRQIVDTSPLINDTWTISYKDLSHIQVGSEHFAFRTDRDLSGLLPAVIRIIPCHNGKIGTTRARKPNMWRIGSGYRSYTEEPLQQLVPVS